MPIKPKKRGRARETFSRYDTVDYLRSREDIVAYLAAVFEEAGDDSALIALAIGNVARAHGMMRLAEKTGLTREGLYKALSKDSNPSFATVLKVINALGMRLTLAPQAA